MVSSTLQDKLRMCKNFLKDAYNTIVSKGGTLPVEQDMVHLNDAIESIPSSPYDFLKKIGVPAECLTEINNDIDIDTNISINSQDDNVPFIYKTNITSNMWYSSNSAIRRILVADDWTGSVYQPLFGQYGLETVIVGNGECVKPLPIGNNYTFYDDVSLKNLYMIFECSGITTNITLPSGGFIGTVCMREIKLKGVNTNISVSGWSALSNKSMIYLLRNLGPDPHTVTLGAANLSRLTATKEGQDAIDYAVSSLGWTIAQ